MKKHHCYCFPVQTHYCCCVFVKSIIANVRFCVYVKSTIAIVILGKASLLLCFCKKHHCHCYLGKKHHYYCVFVISIIAIVSLWKDLNCFGFPVNSVSTPTARRGVTLIFPATANCRTLLVMHNASAHARY